MSTRSTTTTSKTDASQCKYSLLPNDQSSTTFFKLVYYVREKLYDYFDKVRPNTSGKSFSGFVCSCQQLKTELELFTAKQLEKQLRDFAAIYKTKCGYPIGIPTNLDNSTFAQLRKIMVTLPIEAVFVKKDYTGTPKPAWGYGWHIGTLKGLHLLWSNHFDMVHVKLVGDSTAVHGTSAMNVPKAICAALVDVEKMIALVKEGREENLTDEPLLLDKDNMSINTNIQPSQMGDVVGDWVGIPEADIENLGDASTYEWPWYGTERPPTTHIRTKRICFSREFAPDDHHDNVPAPLSGRVYGVGKRRLQSRERSLHFTTTSTMRSIPSRR